jgi:uncharacterized protein YdeI (YjbR/CyaY-like superfamily)
MPERIAEPKRLAEVDRYIANAAPFAQPILTYLRDIVHEGAPGVVEEIKWSRPFFVYHGVILGNISAFKAHCSFGLWGNEIAAAMQDDNHAKGDGMGTFGKLTDVKQLPPRKKLLAYLRLAAKAIDDGVRTTAFTRPRSQVVKAEVAVPESLAAALSRNKAAAKIFATMSPSCRKEYSVWIASAKRDETRDKRVATAIEWIAEGKSHNWRYEVADVSRKTSVKAK